ncbi:hypothetical protein J7E88_19530 [Streptomyces sp. ISL-10]|uniref:DUF6629 family protein n=1 Tax=Streptomyces sp. ISL-10 TaxID=2819172 RepID=UPI001BEA3C12|nr:DUF6629 family protein [Streptomyces sp. ISL-10]MBT2367435.1 hypothetical protein [Streptomyces sp. ISL-10]
MCWSATADLTAGAGIAAVGAACVVTTVRRGRPRDLPLAALPLLLGAHQVVEAVLWTGGGGAGAATTAWAVIALPVLALWVPLGVLVAAPAHARVRSAVPAVAGVATSAALAHVLATRSVTADIRGHTVGYAIGLPHPAWLLTGYLLATVGSLLLATDRALRLLGVLTGLGAVACVLLWRTAFVSTWCAAAAVASVALLGWTLRPAAPGTPADQRRAGVDAVS